MTARSTVSPGFNVIFINTVNMYSCKDNLYELLGTQEISTIENESNTDYENRVIYVCKDVCQDFVNTETYKKTKKSIESLLVILTNPWCIYEIMDLEKKFDKPTEITQKLIYRMMVHKESENVSILRNNIFNIALNGYNVQKVTNQIADTIHLQYLSVYSSANFLTRLKNTLDTIFHLHGVKIDSIYSYINENENENENEKDQKNENQLKIIIEDRGLDLSYIYQNKNVATLFIKSGYLSIKDKIRKTLHVDASILDKILKSKSLNLYPAKLSLNHDKNLNNIWLDLDETSRIKIDESINQELNAIKTHIRDFIDNISIELIQKDTSIRIYCLDESMLFATGFILANSIKNDAYILDKLLTNESNIFTKKIF